MRNWLRNTSAHILCEQIRSRQDLIFAQWASNLDAHALLSPGERAGVAAAGEHGCGIAKAEV